MKSLIHKKMTLHELLGMPDAMQGHGYFKLSNGPLNNTRSAPAGYPYKPEDFIEFDDEDSSEDPEEYTSHDLARSKKIFNKTDRAAVPADLGNGSVFDRRSFASSNNNWIPSTPIFGESKKIDEISSSIRLRSKSSEPGIGTSYGWARPPIWPNPQKKSSNNFYRYKDIVIFMNNPASIPNVSDDLQVDDDEEIIREFIKLYISNII